MSTIVNDAVFWTAFVSTVTGFIIAIVKIASKSACSECSFCGVSVKRNVELEAKEHQYDVEHGLIRHEQPM